MIKAFPGHPSVALGGLDRHARQKYVYIQIKILNLDMICFHTHEVYMCEINRCTFEHRRQRKHLLFSLHFICLPPLNQRDELKGQCWLQCETHILHAAKQEQKQLSPATAGTELGLHSASIQRGCSLTEGKQNNLHPSSTALGRSSGIPARRQEQRELPATASIKK